MRAMDWVVATAGDAAAVPADWNLDVGTRRRNVVRRMATRAANAASLLALIGVGAWTVLSGRDRAASASFDGVLKQIRNARSVRYSVTFQRTGTPPYRVEVMMEKSGRTRVTTQEGRVRIVDRRQGNRRPGSGAGRPVPSGTNVPLSHQEYDPVVNLRTWDDRAVRFVAERERDGVLCNVFRVDQGLQTVLVWADRETDLPIRMELLPSPTDNAPASAQEFVVVASDMIWNTELPEALFSLDLCQGTGNVGR